MSTSPFSRRDFLRTAATGAASLAAFGVPSVNVLGANEEVRVGLLGTGGRCRHLLKSLVTIPNVRIVALCDVYGPRIDAVRPSADPKAFVTGAYKAVLDRKDVDVVLIASPDHWHATMTTDAVAAGKDVYVEKPLTHDASEGAALVEAVRKAERVVQVGTQQRSMPHFQKARELLKAGRAGKVSRVHMTWNRNTDRVKKDAPTIDPKAVDWKAFLGSAREQPFDQYRYQNWRWFWDFGGGLFTDLMVHWVDAVHWLLDLDRPIRAVSAGTHINSEGIWETPDTVQTLLTYPGGVQLHFTGTFSNARRGASVEICGKDATVYLDRGRCEVIPEGMRTEPFEMVLGDGPRGADFYLKPDGELLHLQNWLECVRSRKTPNSPVPDGVRAADAAHLANRALRSGQVAAWKE